MGKFTICPDSLHALFKGRTPQKQVNEYFRFFKFLIDEYEGISSINIIRNSHLQFRIMLNFISNDTAGKFEDDYWAHDLLNEFHLSSALIAVDVYVDNF